MLLEYPETISVDVSARAMVPFFVTGRAALSTGIQLAGVLTEKPSQANGVVLLTEVSVVPQEVKRARKPRMIILFIKVKVKKYKVPNGSRER